jgi:hypothetical protein
MRKILLLSLIAITLASCSPTNVDNINRNDVKLIYGNVANYLKEVSNNGNKPKNIKRKAYVESDQYTLLQSMTALIKWCEYMYSDESFIYSSEQVVTFNINLGSPLKAGIITNCDTENNKFYTSLAIGTTLDDTNVFFYYFDVDYNFDNNSISSFEIRQGGLNIEYANIHYKYQNNIFYEFDPSTDSESEEAISIVEQTANIIEEFKSKLTNVIDLDKDYTEYYNNAMVFAFGDSYQ